MINQISQFMAIILQFANVVIIGYGLYKFLHKPQDTMADELKKLSAKQIELELIIKELRKQLDTSFEKHREQEHTNAVFKRVMLLFANYEVAFCLHTGYEHTEDIMAAKEELDNYLTGKIK